MARRRKRVIRSTIPAWLEALDKHYSSVHIPPAKKTPGLIRHQHRRGRAPAGPSGIHLVATLCFDSFDAIKAGLGSPQGQAAAGDLANFADGGAELYLFDTKHA
jgi:uncharacterized protein (TIGR02118 family)